MNKVNIFELAFRSRLRFNWNGLISVEDLWDLSVEQLDRIFKKLNGSLKEAQTESLLDTKTSTDRVLELKVEIIKYVVSIKLDETKARLEAGEKKQKREFLLSILATKQNEELLGKTAEEIEKMLEEL